MTMRRSGTNRTWIDRVVPVPYNIIPFGQDVKMQRVNQHEFYEFGAVLHPLKEMQQSAKISEAMWPCHRAKMWLQYFLENRVVPLVVCRPSGLRLITAIGGIIPQDFPSTMPSDIDKEVEYHALFIADRAKEFETVLAAELQALDTYFISQKGIYSTPDLIDRADMALDGSVRAIISAEASGDFRQAGRCLAFDLPTAAGFHAMRATENVLRQYHRAVVKPASVTITPDMATCINELRKAGADAKTLAILDQIRDLHRNTIMHPEAFLTPSEGLRLFDIAKSAISAMADQVSLVSLSAPPAAQAAAAS